MSSILLCCKSDIGRLYIKGFDHIEMVDKDASGYARLVGYSDGKDRLLGSYTGSKECHAVFESVMSMLNRNTHKVIDIRNYQKFEHLNRSNRVKTEFFKNSL